MGGSILIFCGGVAVGSYYAEEIRVLYRAYATGTSTAEIQGIATTVPTTTPVATNSALTMTTLEEPLPLIYSDTLEEEKIQEHLKQGAVVLPLGTAFGEPGNVVVTAHSSGSEAFGPYRFAFAQLSELKEGDEFNIDTPTATYTYRVYGSEIVWPHEVDKLPNDERSTVTLVTCWPLWTNFKRLLVNAELVRTDYKI